MPLRDLFRPPLSETTTWKTFHDNWLVKTVDRLNESVLPAGYRAQSARHLGTQIEADAVTLERRDDPGPGPTNGAGGVAVASPVYAPPAAPLTGDVSFTDPDLFEGKVYRGRGGWNLVAAVELVSESNKDREDTRRAFAVKCASYLQTGVSVVVIDVVTTRQADLHDELCSLLDLPDPLRWAGPGGLQAVAYRTVRRGERVQLDAWPFPLAVGRSLPTVPMWLASDLAVPLELEPTYEAACRSLRIG